MSAWEVVPCLLTLRTEFNAIAPGRDKGADGTIGDTAHTSSSDHTPDEDSDVLRDRDADSRNEVHALDIDVDLRTPGLTLEMCVMRILAQARDGDRRLRYIIFNRRIWEAANNWAQYPYRGDDPHTNHAHFSASYVASQEARTDSWHLEDLVTLSETELDQIEARAKAGAAAALDAYARGQLTTGGGSRDGGVTTILARSGFLANTFAPALAAAVAELDLGDVDEDALAAKIAALVPAELVGKVVLELKSRETSPS
jgi:hypothetical protein